MSYAPSKIDLFHGAAVYADKVLKGNEPRRPPGPGTKFDLVLNLKTAQALGLTVPPALLARADEVIE
jgi:putative ABC transport system substrate-binding protein